MTQSPDALAGVVREYVDRARGDRPDNLTPYEVRAFAAMDALLAALAEAMKEREEIVFYLMSASTLSAARAHVERILARRTPQPETPE